jgi:hypothetical protein
METSEIPLSKEAILAVVNDAKLDSHRFPTCEYYSVKIGEVPYDQQYQRYAANFLTRLCALRPVANKSDVHFICPGTTWTELEYTDSQLDVLSEAVVEITNAELRSKIHEILWIRRRNVRDAQLASIAYVDTGEVCMNKETPDAGKRLARGLMLAVTIKDHELIEALGKRVEAVISTVHHADFLVAGAVGELLAIKVYDPNILLAICKSRIASTDNPLAKQRFCTLAQQCAIRSKDPTEAGLALRILALSCEEEAESALMKVIAVSHLKRAIQALRQIPGTEAERDRVHQKMLVIQRDLGSEFRSIDAGSVELTENVWNAQSRIRRKSKIVGIAELILATQFHDESRARDNAIETIRSFPIQNMFAVEKFGSTHKSATAIPPTDLAELNDERIFYSMIIEYQILFGVVAHGTIVPMINELELCHHITTADIAEFVYQSPMIPPGHHEYFCIGILAGLQGRFIEAIHLLMPQLETLLRSILHNEGVVVSGLDQKGNQREFDLNKLLEMPETEKHIGKNIATTLKIIFTHQAGPNIRNELAHGMLTSGACDSPAAIYGWWAIVCLALHPIAQHILEIEVAQKRQQRKKSVDAENAN